MNPCLALPLLLVSLGLTAPWAAGSQESGGEESQADTVAAKRVAEQSSSGAGEADGDAVVPAVVPAGAGGGDDARQAAEAPVPSGAMESRALERMRSLELDALLQSEREQWAARESKLLTKIDELKAELAVERARSAEREVEWLEFTRVLSALPVPEAPQPPRFLQKLLEASVQAPDPQAEAKAKAAKRRSHEVRRDLRALLTAEQVFGIDVLEVGAVQDGFTGPFVARLVDDYGRPVGSLAAERLRLEMSYAAHTITLVLEEGYENRHGERVPFPGETQSATQDPGRTGVRRIHLPQVNPQPWIEAFPELFGDMTQSIPLDDGSWDRMSVRLRLNDLLARRSGGSRWRVRAVGGVWRDELRDVQLAELGPSGQVERRLFADRCRLSFEGRGVRLDLEGGVQVRGDQRVPFLDGRFPIILPRAQAERWADAELPGLVREPEPAAGAPEDQPAGVEAPPEESKRPASESN